MFTKSFGLYKSKNDLPKFAAYGGEIVTSGSTQNTKKTYTQQFPLPCGFPLLCRCSNDLVDSCGEVRFDTAYIFIGFRRAFIEVLPSIK